jgi:drug/metabolite transporter (DMT)-like permease
VATSAIILVIASALLHAAWNAGLRAERDKNRGVVVAIAVGSVVAVVVALVTAAWRGVPFAGPQGTSSLAWTIAAGAFEAVYFYALARALSLGPLGPVYTLSRGSAVLLVWPVSVLLWHENVVVTAVIGSAVLLAGLIFSGAERGASRSAIIWSLICGAFIASYHLSYKAALNAHGEPSAVFALSLSLASAINIARLGAEGRRIAISMLRQRPLRLIGIGCICSVAFLLFMQALANGGAGAIVTLRNTSVVFATGFAWLIGDRPTWRQIVGAALVAGGAIVLALAS